MAGCAWSTEPPLPMQCTRAARVAQLTRLLVATVGRVACLELRLSIFWGREHWAWISPYCPTF